MECSSFRTSPRSKTRPWRRARQHYRLQGPPCIEPNYSLATGSAPCYKTRSHHLPTHLGDAAMDYNGAPRSSGRDTYMTIVLGIFVVLPTFVFLNILTGGLFL